MMRPSAAAFRVTLGQPRLKNGLYGYETTTRTRFGGFRDASGYVVVTVKPLMSCNANLAYVLTTPNPVPLPPRVPTGAAGPSISVHGHVGPLGTELLLPCTMAYRTRSLAESASTL